ncbi:MAG: DNA-directed RNA polymerase subunit delta [Bacilli bacterium]|jgi:DNA-directed RNA polymerase subunit delta
MRKRTNIEIAYDLLKEKGTALPFYELWQKIVNEHEYSEAQGHDMISKFYTSLLMDGRFVNLGDNTWELRERVLFDDIALPLSEVYTDLEETEEDDEDEAPEILYFDDESTEIDPEKELKTIVLTEDE